MRCSCAAGVAERVATERGETVGGTVGYQIRLERRASEHTKLLFVTTGILLRRLQADPQLEGVTHVILDEVRGERLAIDAGVRACLPKPACLLTGVPARLGHRYFWAMTPHCGRCAPPWESMKINFPVALAHSYVSSCSSATIVLESSCCRARKWGTVRSWRHRRVLVVPSSTLLVSLRQQYRVMRR